MKFFFGLSFLLACTAASAQYYLKDIVGSKQSADLIAGYRNAKVRKVSLNSYTINNTPLNDFTVQQEFFPEQSSLRTISKSQYTSASYLTTFVDAAGRIVRTSDSTDGMVNTTTYSYNTAGKLIAVLFRSGDSLAGTQSDDHIWQYDAQGRIAKMLRIKNGRDTSVVTIKLDDAGNVTEEQEKRRAITEEPYYYYYDNASHLTDVVRYNKAARKLLPETMFEYGDKAQIIQRITIPQNSDDYLIWRYAYDAKGLKTKEVIFNKQKEQTGKVEYVYTYGN